ncbi:uncharacterized protein CLUP02_09577 [Colletotrichum lupini]|uniref:Uncharacterized protein n=1 Tax=Colletotrichum lupini TaxID=145971 RepID=A0A9Q8WI34_9PEZI|nr:uncharacterized protein CLUP02_09577 [Colletotrichum lupini]KAK1708525.1 hypothetical protein BDP67DRAFT_524972 [Colletotrichum lupini]UQC84081.1 hypothetical protein CLUP02_09577 [Colletotrichum lupini]
MLPACLKAQLVLCLAKMSRGRRDASMASLGASLGSRMALQFGSSRLWSSTRLPQTSNTLQGIRANGCCGAIALICQ